MSITFSIFLFILFFQPFPLERFDFNNSLLFIAGLAAIIFFLMVLVRLAFPWLLQYYDGIKHVPVLPSYLDGFLMMVFSSVAFAFYLRYVGQINITFYIMFKVIAICIVPPVALRLYDTFKDLKQQNESLGKEKNLIKEQILKYEDDYTDESITLIAESNSEKLTMPVSDIAFIKSADNYVQIVYREGAEFKNKLLRNTLRNIEGQITSFPSFIRCHRTCIVNKFYVDKMLKSYNNHWLTIKGYPEQLPVSRQYILMFRDLS